MEIYRRRIEPAHRPGDAAAQLSSRTVTRRTCPAARPVDDVRGSDRQPLYAGMRSCQMALGYDPAAAGSDLVLAYLQELLLTAVILEERLPGARRPLRVLSGSGLIEIPSRILRSNLARAINLEDLPRRLD